MTGYPIRNEAERILAEAEHLNPGPWVEHSKNVAHCAEAIANVCEDMDSEKAFILGLLHDVGRRAGVGQLMHVYYGWRYMLELGYPEVAKVCLSHSYNTHSMDDDMAICDITEEQRGELKDALKACVFDDYDLLIQLCDSIASLNHYSKGAVVSWLIEGICGIRIKNGVVTIQPQPYPLMQYAQASFDAPCGRIVSGWKYVEGKVEYTVILPANVTATFIMPDGTAQALLPGEHHIKTNERLK